jgi:hypothetical protein
MKYHWLIIGYTKSSWFLHGEKLTVEEANKKFKGMSYRKCPYDTEGYE